MEISIKSITLHKREWVMIFSLNIRRINGEKSTWISKSGNKSGTSALTENRKLEREFAMETACRIGLEEFADKNSKLLSEVSILDRIIFVNRKRKTIIRALFLKSQDAEEKSFDSLNNLNIFSENEIEIVLFNIDLVGSFERLAEVEEFIFKNFKCLRSLEDIENFIKDNKE